MRVGPNAIRKGLHRGERNIQTILDHYKRVPLFIAKKGLILLVKRGLLVRAIFILVIKILEGRGILLDFKLM